MVYSYFLKTELGTRVRAYMNGIPFGRAAPFEPARSTTETAAHLLVPGRNDVRVELTLADPQRMVAFMVLAEGDFMKPLLDFSWPARIPGGGYSTERPLPFTFTGSFEADTTFSPAWADAPEAIFGPEGLPEQRRAVRAYHAALAAGDVDRFLDEGSLKLREMRAAFPHAPSLAPERQRAALGRVLGSGVEAAPLAEDDLVFESHAGGRVAYVTRRSERYVIEARSGIGSSLRADLWLTREDGDWRVFR